jgi:hypothetical protein
MIYPGLANSLVVIRFNLSTTACAPLLILGYEGRVN